ncbi:MAG: GPR1/FUN34/YaaH family transporter [Chloroflexota bacterium]
MLVKDVMERAIEEIPADAPLSMALEKMLRQDGGLVAVSKGGQFLGILTEHDVALWEAEPDHDSRSALVRDVMKANHALLSEQQDVREAARIMQEEHASGLVVVRDQQVVGKVTLADLAIKMAGDGFGANNDNASRLTIASRQDQAVSNSRTATAQREGASHRPMIASPSILGYFGFAAAALVVGAHLVGWYGSATTPLYILAFVALFGGLAQFTTAMWAYVARDGVGTAVHGTWGAFWMAYGVLYVLVANHTLTMATVSQNYGFLLIPICAITAVCVIGAFAENAAVGTTLFVFAAAACIGAVSMLVGNGNWIKVSGFVFMLGAICAWYVGSALLLEGSWLRTVLPMGKMREAHPSVLPSNQTMVSSQM